jgi:hypothetical protein
MATAVQVQLFGDKKLERTFKHLERNIQRKVLRPMTDKVAKKTIKPGIESEIPTRSFDPPKWPIATGSNIKEVSHTGPPGSMKNNIYVKPIKRTRTAVGRVVMLPTRDTLGISKDNPFYYPAAIEYGVKFNKLTQRPQPGKAILRTYYSRKESEVQAAVQREARAALMKEVKKIK